MISFAELPAIAQGIVGLFIVLLLFATVMNIILEIKHHYFNYIAILVLIGIVLYVMFQCICDICSHMNTLYKFLNQVEDYFGRMSIVSLVLLLLGITAMEVFVLIRNKKWEKANITPSSIKEAIDNLPVGICCYEPNGQVMMKNNIMENLCLAYTGEALLNAVSFRDKLYANDDYTEKETIVVLNNGEVFSISDNKFSDEEPILRIMTATDITEQYNNTRRLKEQREVVIKLNKELSDYGKQIVSAITDREVLKAKVKLHDELGANLLAIKRFILNGGTTEERIAIENILRNNIQYLKDENNVKEKDEYIVILDTAAKLDMKVEVIGELTETEPQRHVIVTGIHECLTNTIRHAGGDKLTVILEEDANMLIAKFTNNGKTPESEIKERGGLALFRALTEECGGTMQIIWNPQFELILKLPREVAKHVV